jgi:Domain of unknown function (DUF222)
MVSVAVRRGIIAHMFDGSLPGPDDLRGVDDTALLHAITGWAHTAAAAQARQLAAVAELHRRRCTDPEHPDWACDDTDAAAAEVAAALTIGHGRALALLDLAVLLRDRMPTVGALFLSGAIPQHTISVLAERIYLVQDPAALAELDTVIAHHATAWAPLSKYKLIQAVDAWIDHIDPAAARRTKTTARNRDFTVGTADEKSGTTAVWGRLLGTDAALLNHRIQAMARAVCNDDPRTLAQRRADALGALAAGTTALTCQCAAPTCPATTNDGRATNVVVHILAEAAATTTAPDPQINGDHPENADHAERRPHPTPAPTPPPRPTAGLIVGAGIVPPVLLADLIARGATVTPLPTPCTSAEPRYRPSTALDTFIRMRDLTCRYPGCDRPAITADIDHTLPHPAGPTHPGNLKCYCRKHHLLKTFWPGWTDHQQPDGTIVLTTPSGHTYTTKPGATLLFPTWNVTTPPPPTNPQPPQPRPGRGLMMPTRKTTRTKARHYRITAERALNQQQPPEF